MDRPDTPNLPPAGRRGRRGLAWLTGGVAALAVGLVATPYLLLRSEAGTAWLLGRVPGLQLTAPAGALLGDRLSVQRLVWTGTAGRLEIDAPALSGLQWRWRPAPGQWLGISLASLTADRVHWQSAPAPAPAEPLAAPASLRLPLAVQVPLRIGTLQFDAAPPLQALQATLALGADDGDHHRVDDLRLRWAQGTLRLSARIGSDAPFALAAQADLASRPDQPLRWQASLQAEGPLAQPALRAQLRGLDDAAQADVDARLSPFAAFPLTALQLRTQGLDLSRLAAGLPQTQLTARAELVEPAAGRPLRAEVEFNNATPGRWNEDRLPLREGRFAVQAQRDRPDRIALDGLSLQLADRDGGAGRIRGTGLWQGHGLTLELQLAEIVPTRLDGRAPAWQVGGALGLELDGLPSPDPSAAAPASPWSAITALSLQGRDTGFPQPVFVQAQVRAGAQNVQLERLLATSGPARAEMTGRLRQGATAWAVQTEATLRSLDPVPWWPGLGEAWKKRANRVNASLTLDLSLPAPVARGAWPWQRVDGTARLQFDESLLAGVPVQGRIDLAPAGDLALALSLGGNRIEAGGRLDRTGAGGQDRWQMAVAAPDLGTLAPLMALHPALAGQPLAGRLQADARVQGRWPQLQGEGSVEARGLRTGPLQLAQARLVARAGSEPQSPLALQVDLTDARWQDLHVPTLVATLDGTLAEHRLRLETALPVVPPEALSRSFALNAKRGTRLVAEASGRLARDGGGLQWAGALERLNAGSWDGRLPLSQPAPQEWLELGRVGAELAFGADGALQRLRADAGRLRLARELALSWQEVRYDAGALRVRATVDDVAIAPVLARWQPTVGWEGNLRVGASIAIDLAETTRIDIVAERKGGDLGVREAVDRSIPLGLSDLRLALQAEDGTWTFTQALAGRTLGELGGAQRVRSSPQARWPGADDPLDGALSARVANLAVWGAWVPAGWRLQGAVQTQARLGGRLGAPAFTGELRGEGLGVRNLLQGVHVREGEVLLRLEGERASLERFVLKGGDGTLTLTGGATLGAEPRAQLQLAAERFQLLSRIDRRLIASGQATLALAPKQLSLHGRFGVDEGLFDVSRGEAPSLDDDVTVRREDEPPVRAAAAAAPDPARRIDVQLDLALGDRLRLRGYGLDTRLTGALRITAPGGRLAVNGTVSTADGTYAAYAQKLTIQRGDIAFSGPVDNPRLDVLALRPNLDIDVGVAITGSAQTPRVRLYSSPELPDTDKLSWLVLGRDPGGLDRADTALMQRAAMALLAGDEESTTDALIRNLGLDEFSVRQDEGGTGDTIVSLGKQLSQRWYVGYERGVNATTGTWQLIYRVAQRFTLRAQSGAENALDAIWIWRVP